MSNLSNEDKNSICYFITEKGDVTRWTGWESKKSDIEAEFPELIHALKMLEIAKKTLAAVVKSIDIEY